MESELLGMTATVAAALGRFVSAGAIACFLAYGTVEFIFKPLAVARAKRTNNGTDTEVYLRLTAVFIGMGLVAVFHGNAAPNSVLSFGNGPPGWWMAMASGFMGGGFAGKLHDMFRKKRKEEV